MIRLKAVYFMCVFSVLQWITLEKTGDPSSSTRRIRMETTTVQDKNSTMQADTISIQTSSLEIPTAIHSSNNITSESTGHTNTLGTTEYNSEESATHISVMTTDVFGGTASRRFTGGENATSPTLELAPANQSSDSLANETTNYTYKSKATGYNLQESTTAISIMTTDLFAGTTLTKLTAGENTTSTTRELSRINQSSDNATDETTIYTYASGATQYEPVDSTSISMSTLALSTGIEPTNTSGEVNATATQWDLSGRIENTSTDMSTFHMHAYNTSNTGIRSTIGNVNASSFNVNVTQQPTPSSTMVTVASDISLPGYDQTGSTSITLTSADRTVVVITSITTTASDPKVLDTLIKSSSNEMSTADLSKMYSQTKPLEDSVDVSTSIEQTSTLTTKSSNSVTSFVSTTVDGTVTESSTLTTSGSAGTSNDNDLNFLRKVPGTVWLIIGIFLGVVLVVSTAFLYRKWFIKTRVDPQQTNVELFEHDESESDDELVVKVSVMPGFSHHKTVKITDKDIKMIKKRILRLNPLTEVRNC